jgi:hypothetical protein
VKFQHSLAALAAVFALSLPASRVQAGPELQIPDFTHLRQKAVDSVDVTLDGFLMRVAQKFAAAESDGQHQEALSLLNDIKSVRVRNFTFDRDDAYSREDIDAVRRQLAGPGWSTLVQAHKREPREDVDIYICLENDKMTGLAVIASQPREFTIVNIVGSIDIDKIGQLEGQFGIPRVSQNP